MNIIKNPILKVDMKKKFSKITCDVKITNTMNVKVRLKIVMFLFSIISWIAPFKMKITMLEDRKEPSEDTGSPVTLFERRNKRN